MFPQPSLEIISGVSSEVPFEISVGFIADTFHGVLLVFFSVLVGSYFPEFPLEIVPRFWVLLVRFF